MATGRKELNEKLIATYEAMLEDPDCPQHLKLGAAKALDAHLSASSAERPTGEPEPEEIPDPMADLDELESQRRKRARRAA